MRRYLSKVKKFVLIFPKLEDMHLRKDVGQVPYQMMKHFGFDSSIVTFGGAGGYPSLDRELPGLSVISGGWGVYSFLAGNAMRIDVLMLFHICTRTICRGLVYKLLNPGGCLYVKADLTGVENHYPEWGTRNWITQAKRRLLYNWFIRNVDIVSFECRGAFRQINNVPDKIKLHVPNGFDPELAARLGIAPNTFDEKENLILVVARHGDPRKNSELILDVLDRAGDIGDWRVMFIGTMTPEFTERKDAFLARNQHFREKVVFAGNINDRKALFDYYNRAKILCLSSRSESWGMVCVEALAFGTVPVMSRELASAPDITGDGVAGLTAESDNPDDWMQVLIDAMSDQERLRQLSRNALSHFRRNFIWKDILQNLSGAIHDNADT